MYTCQKVYFVNVGWETKEIENQLGWDYFNLNSNMAYSIDMEGTYFPV